MLEYDELCAVHVHNTNYIMCATLLVMYAVRDLYPEAKSIIFTPDMFVSLSRISTVLHSLYMYVHTLNVLIFIPVLNVYACIYKWYICAII